MSSESTRCQRIADPDRQFRSYQPEIPPTSPSSAPEPAPRAAATSPCPCRVAGPLPHSATPPAPSPPKAGQPQVQHHSPWVGRHRQPQVLRCRQSGEGQPHLPRRPAGGPTCNPIGRSGRNFIMELQPVRTGPHGHIGLARILGWTSASPTAPRHRDRPPAATTPPDALPLSGHSWRKGVAFQNLCVRWHVTTAASPPHPPRSAGWFSAQGCRVTPTPRVAANRYSASFVHRHRPRLAQPAAAPLPTGRSRHRRQPACHALDTAVRQGRLPGSHKSGSARNTSALPPGRAIGQRSPCQRSETETIHPPDQSPRTRMSASSQTRRSWLCSSRGMPAWQRPSG